MKRPEEENIILYFWAMHFSQSGVHILYLQYKGYLCTTSVLTCAYLFPLGIFLKGMLLLIKMEGIHGFVNW